MSNNYPLWTYGRTVKDFLFTMFKILQVQALREGGQPDACPLPAADPVPTAGRAGADHPETTKHITQRRGSCLTFVSSFSLVLLTSNAFWPVNM